MRRRGSAAVETGSAESDSAVLTPQRVAVGAQADLTHDDREAEAVLGAAVFDEGELIGPHDLDLPGKAGVRLGATVALADAVGRFAVAGRREGRQAVVGALPVQHAVAEADLRVADDRSGG